MYIRVGKIVTSVFSKATHLAQEDIFVSLDWSPLSSCPVSKMQTLNTKVTVTTTENFCLSVEAADSWSPDASASL